MISLPVKSQKIILSSYVIKPIQTSLNHTYDKKEFSHHLPFLSLKMSTSGYSPRISAFALAEHLNSYAMGFDPVGKSRINFIPQRGLVLFFPYHFFLCQENKDVGNLRSSSGMVHGVPQKFNLLVTKNSVLALPFLQSHKIKISNSEHAVKQVLWY